MISNDPVFVSERGAPLSAPGFSPMIERAAVVAKHGIKAYAHMLCHAAGFKITNDGIDTRALQPISATGIFRTQPDAPL